MEKSIFRASFLFLFFISPVVYSQCTTTYAYASAGSSVVNISTYCPPGNLGAFMGGSIPGRYSPTISPEAHIAKTCAEEKGRIEMANGKCMNIAAQDNLTQTARCAAMKDSGWSWGGSAGFQVVFASVTYTIQDPNYQKCTDLVVALTKNAESICDLSKKTSESIARSANNARCASFYK